MINPEDPTELHEYHRKHNNLNGDITFPELNNMHFQTESTIGMLRKIAVKGPHQIALF